MYDKKLDLMDAVHKKNADRVRNVCVLEKIRKIDEDFIRNYERIIDILLDWAAHYCYEFGYNPEDIEAIKRDMDYDRSQAIEIEMRVKKNPDNYRNILYFMHKRQQEVEFDLNQQKISNATLKERNAGLLDENKELKRNIKELKRNINILCIMLLTVMIVGSVFIYLLK